MMAPKSATLTRHDIVTLALHTGMRKGEILSLEWDLVDFVEHSMRIDKSKSHTLPANASSI